MIADIPGLVEGAHMVRTSYIEYDRIGQNRAVLRRTGQDRTGQDRTGQDRIE